MAVQITHLLPEYLSGPRTYFTDLDPKDADYNEADVIRKLKLQLLLKKTVVIAASSLFHDVGHTLFLEHPGLIPALERGIIVPALRDQFSTPADFFHGKPEYSIRSRSFFTSHVQTVIPWSLSEASGWFKMRFMDALRTPSSVLRAGTELSEEEADKIAVTIEDRISLEPEGSRFLQRKHIKEAAATLDPDTAQFLNSFGHLLYRLQGANIVKSAGHFPQSNLTRLHLHEEDSQLVDASVFWDLYVEAVLSALNSVVRLTPERLDRLSFKDVLTMRAHFFEMGFSEEYDRLIETAKQDVNITDPDRLILHMQEINSAAGRLREEFRTRVYSEITVKDTSSQENALWQVVNVIALLATPVIQLIVGVLSTLKSLPEITAIVSPNLSKAIADRKEWIRRFANNRIGWSEPQRRVFLDAYETMASYGIPSRHR